MVFSVKYIICQGLKIGVETSQSVMSVNYVLFVNISNFFK